MKKYIIFAGINGCGKSTLYQSNDELLAMPRVNVDEIVRKFGSWKNSSDVMKAGIIAVKQLKEYLNQGISFNQETTLCGKTAINNIRMAKELGYYIELHYVSVDSVEIAKERVKIRVANGGHGIPDADIEKRYIETFENLKRILPICNIVEFYDNTMEFRKVAIYKDGQLVRKVSNCPKWFEKLDI